MIDKDNDREVDRLDLDKIRSRRGYRSVCITNPDRLSGGFRRPRLGRHKRTTS
jgi:hypothetical protein